MHYESLVADFDSEVAAALDFLNLPRDDAVRDYADHARARGLINTPSYEQVLEPVYRSASYRWQRYRDQFVPYLRDLESYILELGYTC